MRKLIVVAALTGLAACQSASETPTGQKLSAAQYRSEIPGHTVAGRSDTGTNFEASFSTDGTASVKGANFNDTGTYRVNDDGIVCTTWKTLLNGAEQCTLIYRDGDTYRAYRTLDSGLSATYKIVK